MPVKSEPAVSLCASCGQRLAGRYCSDCGEERLDFHSLTVRHFVTHSLHEVFELDGKIWRTLRALMFRPGFLAAEYCEGRRRRYINPFRLLITAALAYALATRGGLQVAMTMGPVVLSLAPAAVSEGVSITETIQRVDRFHLLRGLLAEPQKSAEFESESMREKFHQRMERFSEPLSFANVLMLALVLRALFGRRRKYFAEHGVFSMHFMSFVLFTGLLFFPAPFLLRAGWGAVVLPVMSLILLWQFVHLVLAIRRFYFSPGLRGILPRAGAGFGAAAAYFLNSVFITCVQTLGAALALWMIGTH
jgi:hypothetical protein